ncbi:MAG: hypothetical protein RBT19_05280 [Tenuifilaceae bacterium]|jgi:hypothetical protein|nr:hypothetical protein [Tenuifilaceae bacterium]
MSNCLKNCLAAIVMMVMVWPSNAQAQVSFDVEAGIVSTGYNNVRIPGDAGTFLSLSDELSSSAKFFSRLKVGYRIGERHEVLALFAPLEFSYRGVVDRDITFQNEVFLAGTNIDAIYKFNSYRLSYRYLWVQNPKFHFYAGVTLKVRDANIGLKGLPEQEAVKTDLGVVPLINFYMLWKPTNRFGLLLDGDALAAPQGRAEDVLVAATFKLTNSFTAKAGYRLLEGGADNATVYTYSMFHYGVIGVIINLD